MVNMNHLEIWGSSSLKSFEESLEKYSEHINENTGRYLVVESVEMNSYIFLMKIL